MCQGCDWEGVSEEIEAMLDESRYEFAEETLGGIYDTIQDMGHCSPGQKKAIENIKNSKKGRDEW